ncbi:MAG: hypothetical protein AAGC47_08970 [Bacteroidota bacterium]
MKLQDKFLMAVVAIVLIVAGCNEEEDSPQETPEPSCDLVCFNGGLVNTDSCACACLEGFSGDSCEVVEPTCDLVCQNGGTLDEEACSCDCPEGFSGDSCHVVEPSCDLVCQNGGILDEESCSCDCPEGFSGDSCEVEPSRSELLTSKTWVTTGLTVNPALAIGQNGNPETNLIPFIQACDLDNFENYNTNGSYTVEEGATKCDPNAPTIIDSGDWLWNSDETKLITESNDGSSLEFTIVSISSTELVREFVEVSDGVTYTFTQTSN